MYETLHYYWNFYYWQFFVPLSSSGKVEDIGWLDIVLVLSALAVVVWAFYRAVALFLRPGESAPGHIKRRILEDD
jgi:hypothetical protein